MTSDLADALLSYIHMHELHCYMYYFCQGVDFDHMLKQAASMGLGTVRYFFKRNVFGIYPLRIIRITSFNSKSDNLNFN